MKQLIETFNVNEKKIIYLLYLIPIGILSGSLIINSLIILIDILFLYEIAKSKKFEIFKTSDFYILIIIYLYLIFNSIYIAENNDGYLRAFGFIRFIIFTFALAYYFSIENSKYFKKVLKLWCLIFIIASLDIIFESFVGFNFLGFKSEYPGRLGGFTMDEYKIGGYFLGFVLLSLTIFVKEKNYLKILILTFLFILVTFLTGERSNFIKIFIILSLFILFYENKFFKKKLFAILSIIFVISSIFYLLPKDNDFKERFESRYISGIIEPLRVDGFDKFFQNNEHFKIYKNSINVFQDNKLFGVGIKQYRHKSYLEKYNLDTNSQGSLHPHQIHFEFIAELGLIGYFLLMFLIFKKMLEGFKNFKKGDLYSLSALLFLIATVMPILPGGSFFTTYNASIFWVNFSIILRQQFTQTNS